MERLEHVECEPTPRPFQCDWEPCNKCFRRKTDLQRHYRIHTNERPYTCMTSGCGKNFIQRSALTVHIRTHTGEKPYQCQHIDCRKRFSDSSSLARHRRIHNGKRPYKCTLDGCLKSFCRKITMVKHQRQSHQHGLYHHDILGDCTSEAHIDKLLPSQTTKSWPMQEEIAHPAIAHRNLMHRIASFADFGHNMNQYSIGQQIGHQHIMPAEVHEYHSHDLNIHMGYQTASIPQQPYYVIDRNNPSIATFAFI